MCYETKLKRVLTWKHVHQCLMFNMMHLFFFSALAPISLDLLKCYLTTFTRIPSTTAPESTISMTPYSPTPMLGPLPLGYGCMLTAEVEQGGTHGQVRTEALQQVPMSRGHAVAPQGVHDAMQHDICCRAGHDQGLTCVNVWTDKPHAVDESLQGPLCPAMCPADLY